MGLGGWSKIFFNAEMHPECAALEPHPATCGEIRRLGLLA
jgi:hypothetical protein